MSHSKGKGLSTEEKLVYDRNEAVFNGNFLGYLRSLAEPLDIEFAQLRRRYQSTYEETERWHCHFTHKISNTEGLEGFGYFAEFPQLTIEIKVAEGQLMLRALTDFLTDELRDALAKEMKAQCLKLKSFVRGLGYVDVHIASLLKECDRSLVYVEEEVKDNSYSNESSEQDEPLESYPDDFVVSSRSPPVPKTASSASKKKVTLPDSAAPPKKRGYVSKESSDKLRLSTDAMNLYGVATAQLSSIVLQGTCKTCNTPCTCELTLSSGKLEGSQVCTCGRQLEISLQPSVVSLTSFVLGQMTARGLRYLMAISMSFGVSCFSCLEDLTLSVLPQTSLIGNCQHCMNKFHFKVDQINIVPVAVEMKQREDRPKKVKHSNGLKPGTPLPKQGSCKHYKQSFRWLRFPCCNQVYPCDECHNRVAGHNSEFANRMICGFCSREQNYSSTAPCNSCKADMTGKGKGNSRFWEGGKGCRDSAQLSRNDKRKFKNK